MITETDELAAAIDSAILAWPELNGQRSEALRRLVLASAQKLQEQDRLKHQRETRLAAIAAIGHDFDGMWNDNWLEELRSEWPD